MKCSSCNYFQLHDTFNTVRRYEVSFRDFDTFDTTIEEWWDSEGRRHTVEPYGDGWEDARAIVVHVTDSSGDDRYFTIFSEIGWWTPEQFEADVEDGFNGGSGKAGRK